MSAFAVQIDGLAALVAKCRATSVALETEFREGLLAVADIVAEETVSLFEGSDIDFGAKTIAGVKARVLTEGTAIAQQQLRKSRNLNRRRPNFGPLQMTRGFLPAIDNKQAEIEVAADAAVQAIVSRTF